MMEKRTFILQLREGMQEEYKRRHRDIWPEMLQMLHNAGIRNYPIWLYEDKLFGYYESENLFKTEAHKVASKVQMRWNSYMEDVIFPLALYSKGNQPECVFNMK